MRLFIQKNKYTNLRIQNTYNNFYNNCVTVIYFDREEQKPFNLYGSIDQDDIGKAE